MDYLTIVNKRNLINDDYYKDLELVETKDVLGNTIKVERKTFEAYSELKEYLKNKNIFIELDSAYRSIEEQQRIIDDYTIKYGIDYVNKYVAPIKTSEHHTGLALDLVIVVDGKIITENDDLFQYEDIFLEIHKYLSKFGFILRYPKGKENITGYNYEPWHIRYVEKEAANIIEKCNLTFEEYLELRKTKMDEIKTPQDILGFMNGHIRYGWLDIDNEEHIGNMKNFRRLYRTSSIEEVLKHGLGTCIEQVMLMHYLLDRINVENKMFCTRVYEGRDFNNLEAEEHMHCFILYYMDNKVYQLEHPNWEKIGIHEYATEEDAINEINDYYVKMAEGKSRPIAEFFEVKPGISFKEFNLYINSLKEANYEDITIKQ